MCGLVGVFRPSWTTREQSALVDLALISQVRGIDSTGIVKLSAGKKSIHYEVNKDAVSAAEFLYDNRKTLFTPPQPNTSMFGMLLHVRAATKGVINVDNAHPFEFDKFVGMHNGTIHGMFKYSSQYGTDSEAIYKNIDSAESIEDGLKEVNKAYTKVAYALMFYNKISGEIHFIRNKERPLYLAWESATDTYVAASEKHFIKYLEKRHKFKFRRIVFLPENKLITIQLQSNGRFHFSEKSLKVEKPPYVAPQSTTRPTYNGHGQGYGGVKTEPWTPPGVKDNDEYTFKTIREMTWPTDTYLAELERKRFFFGPSSPQLPLGTPSTGGDGCKVPTKEEVSKVVDLDEPHRAPYLNVSRHEWDGIVADGCMYCATAPFYNQRKQLVWFDDNSFLCPHCAQDKSISAFVPLNTRIN